MIDKRNKIESEERAVLIGLIQKDQTETQVQEYLDELSFLATTAGAVAVKTFTQKLPHPDSRTFIGKGKLEEIRQYVAGKNIRIAIFDDELSGAQINNIEARNRSEESFARNTHIYSLVFVACGNTWSD